MAGSSSQRRVVEGGRHDVAHTLSPTTIPCLPVGTEGGLCCLLTGWCSCRALGDMSVWHTHTHSLPQMGEVAQLPTQCALSRSGTRSLPTHHSCRTLKNALIKDKQPVHQVLIFVLFGDPEFKVQLVLWSRQTSLHRAVWGRDGCAACRTY